MPDQQQPDIPGRHHRHYIDMANPLDKKTSQLPTVSSLAGTEYIYGIQGGVSKKFPVVLFGGGGTTPPPVDPSLRLKTGGDYINDPDYEGVDLFHYILLAATWEAEDGSDKSLPETPFAVAPAATGMARLDVPCLSPTGSGALVIITGTESASVLEYPAIPDGYIALQSIFVDEEESYPYPYNIPTSNRDGSTGEIRKNSQTFAQIDNLDTLHGKTADEKFEIDFAEFHDTDTVSVEEGVDPDTGDRKIQFNATGGGGGGDYTLPIASDSVLGGIKVGQGLEIDGTGILSVLATSTNFIYMSPDGDDATGQRGNVGAPYASIAAAKLVFQTGDVISVNPGTYTGQANMWIPGKDATYYFAPGADVTFTTYAVASGTADTVTVRGSGRLRGSIYAENGATNDLEFDEIIATDFINTGGVFGGSVGRYKGRSITINGTWAATNSSTATYEVEEINHTSTANVFADYASVIFTNCHIAHAARFTVYVAGTPVNYAIMEFHNCVLTGPGYGTSSGSGLGNSFYGRTLFHNTTINSTGYGIYFWKFGFNPGESEFWFDNANINAASGFHSLDATNIDNAQCFPPNIRIFSPGGLKLNNDVAFDVTRPITNLIPGSYALRDDYTASAAVASRFSGIKVKDEPGSGSGGGSALTVKDEGTSLSTAVTSIDFTGAGVTATNTGGAVTVNVPSGGGGDVTLTGTQTLTNKTLTSPVINTGNLGSATVATTQTAADNSTKVATTAYVDGAVTASGAVSASSTTTFTNKSISGATNTLSNIAQSSVTNLTTDLAAFQLTQQSHTSGATVTVSSASGPLWLIVNPATLLSALAITMPATPVDGQRVEVSFGGTKTSTSQALIEASSVTTAEAGETISYRWKSSNSKWYRIN
jgi:hypothetical protein